MDHLKSAAGPALKLAGQDTDTFTISGYAAMWGSVTATDLDREFFTSDTQFWEEDATNLRLLWDHLLPSDIAGPGILGRVKSLRKDKLGLWMLAVIQKSHEYAAMVASLIGQNVLGISTGSSAHLVLKAHDGEILRWPLTEISVTPRPSEWRTIPHLRASTGDADAELQKMYREFTAGEKARKAKLDREMTRVYGDHVLREAKYAGIIR